MAYDDLGGLGFGDTDALADALADAGVPADAFGVFVRDIAGTEYYDADDYETAVSDCTDAYISGYDSVTEYAYDYAEDCLGLSGTALDYFDADKFGRDLVLGGDISAVSFDGSTYLFHGVW